MKKLIISAIIVVFFSSCEEKGTDNVEKFKDNMNVTRTITTFEHDGCEYFSMKVGSDFGTTHKGNCKNHNYLDGRSFKDKINSLKKEESIKILLKTMSDLKTESKD